MSKYVIVKSRFCRFLKFRNPTEQESWHFFVVVSYKWNTFDCVLGGWCQTERYRRISIWILIYVKFKIAFWRFCAIRIPTWGTQWILFLFWIVLLKPKALEWKLDVKIKNVVLDGYEFENRDLLLLKAFLTFLACQDSIAKKKVDDFFSEKSSWSERLSTDFLLEERYNVVMDKIEFEHWTLSKLFIYFAQSRWKGVNS